MAKKVKDSNIAMEIRKEYLKEHLEYVRQLINSWIIELRAASPLAPREGGLGWQSVYQPPAEGDTDSNHMLRYHVRSRSLWNHHSNWEVKLGETWRLVQQLRERANEIQVEQSANKQKQYSEYYLDTALWKGFELACGRKIDKWYKVPDNELGVAYGAYKIELSVSSQDERSSVEKEHWALIHQIAELEPMKELAQVWHEVAELEEKMVGIASRILKSNDVLYPCRFCRHLWK